MQANVFYPLLILVFPVWTIISKERIGGVMIIVLTSNVVNRGFNPQSDQTKDYEIGICCFSSKHVALWRKSKVWMTRNQDNVSEWATCLFADCCSSEHYAKSN